MRQPRVRPIDPRQLSDHELLIQVVLLEWDLTRRPSNTQRRARALQESVRELERRHPLDRSLAHHPDCTCYDCMVELGQGVFELDGEPDPF